MTIEPSALLFNPLLTQHGLFAPGPAAPTPETEIDDAVWDSKASRKAKRRARRRKRVVDAEAVLKVELEQHMLAKTGRVIPIPSVVSATAPRIAVTHDDAAAAATSTANPGSPHSSFSSVDAPRSGPLSPGHVARHGFKGRERASPAGSGRRVNRSIAPDGLPRFHPALGASPYVTRPTSPFASRGEPTPAAGGGRHTRSGRRQRGHHARSRGRPAGRSRRGRTMSEEEGSDGDSGVGRCERRGQRPRTAPQASSLGSASYADSRATPEASWYTEPRHKLSPLPLHHGGRASADSHRDILRVPSVSMSSPVPLRDTLSPYSSPHLTPRRSRASVASSPSPGTWGESPDTREDTAADREARLALDAQLDSCGVSAGGAAGGLVDRPRPSPSPPAPAAPLPSPSPPAPAAPLTTGALSLLDASPPESHGRAASPARGEHRGSRARAEAPGSGRGHAPGTPADAPRAASDIKCSMSMERGDTLFVVTAVFHPATQTAVLSVLCPETCWTGGLELGTPAVTALLPPPLAPSEVTRDVWHMVVHGLVAHGGRLVVADGAVSVREAARTRPRRTAGAAVAHDAVHVLEASHAVEVGDDVVMLNARLHTDTFVAAVTALDPLSCASGGVMIEAPELVQIVPGGAHRLSTIDRVGWAECVAHLETALDITHDPECRTNLRVSIKRSRLTRSRRASLVQDLAALRAPALKAEAATRVQALVRGHQSRRRIVSMRHMPSAAPHREPGATTTGTDAVSEGVAGSQEGDGEGEGEGGGEGEGESCELTVEAKYTEVEYDDSDGGAAGDSTQTTPGSGEGPDTAEAAATRIQAVMRGRRDRRRLRQQRQQRGGAGAQAEGAGVMVGVSAKEHEAEEAEALAATRIQAAARGRRDRERVAQLRARREQEEQGAARQREQERALLRRQECAATRIQASARGRRDRRRVARLREEETRLADARATDDAATHIQALARGSRDRRRVRELRQQQQRRHREVRGATRLQAWSRGHLTRKRLRAESEKKGEWHGMLAGGSESESSSSESEAYSDSDSDLF